MNSSARSITTREAFFESLTLADLDVIQRLDAIIRKGAPKLEPYVHGGFLSYGKYTFTSASKKTGEWMVVAVARQKQYFSLYVCALDKDGYLAERNADKLGNVSVGKSCIRFKKLEDLHLPTVKRVLKEAQTWAVKNAFHLDYRGLKK